MMGKKVSLLPHHLCHQEIIMSYLVFDIKNGVEYASVFTSRRKKDKEYKEIIYLGKVIDEKLGIYENRERGIFTYDVETGTYGTPPVSYILPRKTS
jgi:hypothetical protein